MGQEEGPSAKICTTGGFWIKSLAGTMYIVQISPPTVQQKLIVLLRALPLDLAEISRD